MKRKRIINNKRRSTGAIIAGLVLGVALTAMGGMFVADRFINDVDHGDPTEINYDTDDR